ncbi:zinc finger domain-containing [Pyrenophora seminiperda CCB06]|uniref:Zinc finger domain-containing n=1 Tax=Pyrenophora seminiperda CCB06 TaxID=1302712 RepID=A0A3M7MDD7_9PLEO|nr:zinc finger domain-containing [Pyrenophora seminiperda CCB06]
MVSHTSQPPQPPSTNPPSHQTNHIMDPDPDPAPSPPLPLLPLPDFRIPHYPTSPLYLNQKPLSIYSLPLPSSFSLTTTTTATTSIEQRPSIDPATAIATILYNWHPLALTAFLDLDAWFSLTWSAVTKGQPRTGTGEGGEGRGVGGKAGVDALAQEVLGLMLEERIWENSTKSARRKWGFSVEYAPGMDTWGDGLVIDPRWLYSPIDLQRCTACSSSPSPSSPSPPSQQKLQRCGRCGTASYCNDTCQRSDWKVHSVVCKLGLEERGTAIKVVEKGGLVRWDEGRLFAGSKGEEGGEGEGDGEGKGERSMIPWFEG